MTTYRDAGVDIDKANSFVEYIKKKVAENFGKGFAESFGGFASGIKLGKYKSPVIFSTTDGVGTKLKIAQEMGIHDTVGIDLVAMNVNDLITTGAEPLLFLDYIATGKIELDILQRVMDGIVEGCKIAEVLLAGGETAEMPGFYPEGVYDLAGFCVGVCEEDRIITGKDIRPGDILIGITSSGFHSNGYSLIRKVLKDRGIRLEDTFEDLGKSVGEVLLTPTKIYTNHIRRLKEEVFLKGIAHITGGGIPENLVRILPDNVKAEVYKSSLPENPLFSWIQRLGRIREEEMFTTFNMGIGMVVVVDKKDEERVLSMLGSEGVRIGFIKEGRREVNIAY